MDIIFCVNHQHIEAGGDTYVVADSRNYLHAQLTGRKHQRQRYSPMGKTQYMRYWMKAIGAWYPGKL